MRQDKVALYPGSFDPVTMGHVDIIERALRVFDRVIVAVAVNTTKSGLFDMEERVELIRKTFIDTPQVEVVSFSGLLVDYLRENKINTILRGLRAISDFDYEFQIASMNNSLSPDVDTVFLMTSQKYYYISSSVIKEVARFGGDISDIVPPPVYAALKDKFSKVE
ncbi:MAG: pantetheine-phosphate adenylyltransferase [Deltaproteobacteria bacterium]|nr:pantetheine-phosphate adenylyltransferase [Deltaproteobacteria bacterium]